MKAKGFTLIELLAVIVILAIISLIATPVVLNIIKDSKNSSLERSAELYINQVITEISRYNMTHPGSNFNPNECEVQSDGNLMCNGTLLKVEINGTKPDAGSKIFLSNGSITGLGDFKISDVEFRYIDGKITRSNDIVLCKRVSEVTTGNVPRGKYVAGDEYTCDVGDGEDKKFFVLGTNGNNVSLIMYTNVGVDGKAVTSSSTNKSTVEWVSKEDYVAAGGTEADYGSYGKNDKGPITITKALKEYTSTWSNISQSQITLPSNKQLIESTGPNPDLFYTDYSSDNYKTRSSIKWLYDNGTGVSGYWTSTAGRFDYGCVVDSYGFLNGAYVTSKVGIRPVITIPKSKLN